MITRSIFNTRKGTSAIRFLEYFFSFVLFVIAIQTASGQVKTETITLGEKIQLYSSQLKEERTVLVRLPRDYENSDQLYPVLYVLDGEFFFLQASSAVNYLSELGYITNQRIPQMIVVGIVNVDRNRDYTPSYAPKQLKRLEFPTSGKADRFLAFMKTELVPYIESHYRTQPYRILTGWSLGGLFTVYAYLEYPDLFSAYLAVSPSLWWDEDLFVKKTASSLKQGKMSGKRITVTLGALEGGDMDRSVRRGFIPLMKRVSEKQIQFDFIEIPGEGHNYVSYKALYEGLKSIYSDWQMPSGVLKKGMAGIESFYRNLSTKYGYTIPVPESAYSQLANYVYNQVSTEAAIDVSKQYVDAYPQSSYAYYRLGRFNHLKGDFDAARKCYEKAIELESKTSRPDSERLIMYRINLDNVKREIKGMN
jgi:predicted alpha/beta superfamily hydrolase